MLTQQMMEVLVSVARLPMEYRLLRSGQLKTAYEHVLTCEHAKQAFWVLIDEIRPELVSEKARATVRAAERRAMRDEPVGALY
ncbi:MAG: hypothetical protein Q8M16_01525 [Pirellulaceae bacterium]|nr:hypothetical protein [Pirellulaceae bacterium]